LNQRLGSFPTKSRAAILPLCRQDYPLPSPINRGSVDDLREEKFGSKVSQKPAFSAQFSCNRSFLFFLSPLWPSATTTLITGLSTISSTIGSHQPTTENNREPFSLLSAAPPVFFFFFCFLCHRPPTLPPFLATKPPGPSAQPPDHGRDHRPR